MDKVLRLDSMLLFVDMLYTVSWSEKACEPTSGATACCWPSPAWTKLCSNAGLPCLHSRGLCNTC